MGGRTIARWVVAFGLGLLTAGCPASAFVCESDPQCGNDGQCESNGFCSFPDEACDSGRRYGEHSGTGLAGTCVDEPVASESTADSPDTASSTTASAPDTDPDSGRGSTGPAGSTGPLVGSTSIAGTTSTTTGALESTGEAVERVTDGLLVFYPLDEGGGRIAHDHSGVGEPLDLQVEGLDIDWSPEGLVIAGDDAIARGIAPPIKIIAGCQATGQLTVEAWVTPTETIVTGPGRIATLSEDTTLRNFTLGQGRGPEDEPAALYSGRVRTDDETSSPNGTPQLETPPLLDTVLTHVAYTRGDDGFDRLYVDGQLEAEGIRTGNFSTWSDDAEFAVGNELTLTRAWPGTVHLVAVYDRALTPEEIQQNLDAGP